MKPPVFTYFAPRTIDEILALLTQYGSDARLLAGGQSLVPLMNLRMARPEVLIDLNRCPDLRKIEKSEPYVSYGAMVRQIDAQLSEDTRTHCPLVTKALAHAGPIAVRNRATVGGTLAHADRSAELPGVAVALDATLVLESASGRRAVTAQEFFLGDMTTALQPDEILRSVTFPTTSAGSFSHFSEVGIRREGVAMVGLAAHIVFSDERNVIRDARLAVIGVEPAPVRLKAVESELKAQELQPALIARAGDLARTAVDSIDDAHVKARYRRYVSASLVRRALEAALTGGDDVHAHS
jgi:CO/xanthine dehydrogenase FAD-binding subunit